MDPLPMVDEVPTWDGGATKYKPAGKLEGRKALITGGDSGIGRAIAVLYAMEGADSYIVYLPEEQSDAEKTKEMVEGYGRKCYLHATDLRSAENCKEVAKQALEKLGKVNILVNNAAYQMMQETILDIPEDQWIKTFDTNIHRKCLSFP
jgi:NAD(P)-dependent dehydrogenase (short-subunit alcohol dehydrogenase family)